MALFGFKKKNFDANTQKAINRIFELSASASSADIKAKLDCIRVQLGRNQFTNGKSKEMKGIDARVFAAIDGVARSMQKGSEIEIFGYCDILLNAVTGARAFGKEVMNATEIAVEENMMHSVAEMEKGYADIEKIEKQMAELVESGKKLSGIAKQRLSDQYGMCTKQQATCNANLEEMRKVYNNNCEILNRQARSDIYQNVHRVATLKEFQDDMRVSTKRKLEFDKTNAGFEAEFDRFDSYMGVEKSKNNNAELFENAINASRKIDAFESANSTTPKVGDTESEFDRLTRTNENK